MYNSTVTDIKPKCDPGSHKSKKEKAKKARVVGVVVSAVDQYAKLRRATTLRIELCSWKSRSLSASSIFAPNLLYGIKTTTFYLEIHFEEEEVAALESNPASREVGSDARDGTVKILSGRVVTMEHLIAIAPRFRSFAPNVLYQTSQNVTAGLGIDSLILETNSGCTTPRMSKKKNDKHDCDFIRTPYLPGLIRSCR